MSNQPMGPDSYDADELMAHLIEVQARTRQIMREFNISSDHITVMARRAELAISDTSLRAEFLRLLIDLHEFGREARSRGLLNQPKGETSQAQRKPANTETKPDTGLFDSTDDAADAVSDEASRAFFAHLDR